MLRLATIDLCIKFEISTLTHYKDNYVRRRKRKNLGGLAGLGATQGHQQHSHSIEHIRLPIRL